MMKKSRPKILELGPPKIRRFFAVLREKFAPRGQHELQNSRTTFAST
jgi:hypothetical protein